MPGCSSSCLHLPHLGCQRGCQSLSSCQHPVRRYPGHGMDEDVGDALGLCMQAVGKSIDFYVYPVRQQGACMQGPGLFPFCDMNAATPPLSVHLLKTMSRCDCIFIKNCSNCSACNSVLHSSRNLEPGVSARAVFTWEQNGIMHQHAAALGSLTHAYAWETPASSCLPVVQQKQPAYQDPRPWHTPKSYCQQKHIRLYTNFKYPFAQSMRTTSETTACKHANATQAYRQLLHLAPFHTPALLPHSKGWPQSQQSPGSCPHQWHCLKA
eukprot:1157624-Pelagomonas_calceolata.AAC.5